MKTYHVNLYLNDKNECLFVLGFIFGFMGDCPVMIIKGRSDESSKLKTLPEVEN